MAQPFSPCRGPAEGFNSKGRLQLISGYVNGGSSNLVSESMGHRNPAHNLRPYETANRQKLMSGVGLGLVDMSEYRFLPSSWSKLRANEPTGLLTEILGYWSSPSGQLCSMRLKTSSRQRWSTCVVASRLHLKWRHWASPASSM